MRLLCVPDTMTVTSQKCQNMRVRQPHTFARIPGPSPVFFLLPTCSHVYPREHESKRLRVCALFGRAELKCDTDECMVWNVRVCPPLTPLLDAYLHHPHMQPFPPTKW